MVNHFAVLTKAGGAIRHQPLPLGGPNRLTQIGFTGETELALAALRGIQRNHMITHGHTVYPRANLHHHTRTLVPQNGRKYAFGIRSTQSIGIRMADAGGHQLHHDFPLFGALQIHFFNTEGFACFPGDGGAGFHNRGFLVVRMGYTENTD